MELIALRKWRDGAAAPMCVVATAVTNSLCWQVVNVSVAVATVVNTEGRREIIGMDVGTSEDCAFWLAFLRSLIRDNYFCRPVASSENVTDILRLLIVAHRYDAPSVSLIHFILTGAFSFSTTAMIPYGPSGTGSDPFHNWLRCLPDDLSIRSRGGP